MTDVTDLGIVPPAGVGISMCLTEELVADVAEHYGEPEAETVIVAVVQRFEEKLRDQINAYAQRQE